MKIFTDQLGRTLDIPNQPKRIISLVPSQTELLHYLGLGDRVVGITKFCIHPTYWFRTKSRVGGTKKLDLDAIRALQPDLIIGNKEENEQAQIEHLMREYPVWMSDINNMDEALAMIAQVGAITGTEEKAQLLVREFNTAWAGLPKLPDIPTAYFIWRGPWMVAGHTTYINDLMGRCGLVNVFADRDSRYPEITEAELKETQPQLILLSSEPYPFKDAHIGELQRLCPQAKIMPVDGEMFSWYGSRMLPAAEYLGQVTESINNWK